MHIAYAFGFPLLLTTAADHPSPGSHHPGEAQLPGLRLPGDRGRLQHGCALPFTMVSRGTSEPLPRQRGGEGYWESTTRDVPRLPVCSIQQLLGCRGTCRGGTGKGRGCDSGSPQQHRSVCVRIRQQDASHCARHCFSSLFLKQLPHPLCKTLSALFA